ncbi:hypothetical protein GOP47_0013430 [Adiantum capillus-veneris]|nr:hypothetical protein GOP47_0013430 [Adiantum capillus-veneris]
MLSGRTTSDTQSEAGTSREAEDHNQQKFVCIKVNKEGNASNTAPKLLTGDIVKNVSLEGKKKATITLSSDRGKQALLDGLRQYSCPGQKLIITVLRQGRGEPFTTEAKLVNKNLKTTSNPIILQDRQDQSHEFTFEDYKEWMKAQVEQLEGMKVKAATVDISELLQATPNDSHIGSCYSMVVVPQWNTKFSRFNNVDETVSQARSWFNASINSGVPLLFINIQTEPFVLDLESSSYGGLSSISSTGTYGLQPSRGAASLDVVRAIRMWFRFEFPEFEIELQANQAEEFLGVGIGGTTEGFCHVTHVGPDTAASRKHLHTKLEVADRLEKKLVVTQVGNEKVLPWFISDRKIRCFNVQSILDILSAYRRACRPISLHILDM